MYNTFFHAQERTEREGNRIVSNLERLEGLQRVLSTSREFSRTNVDDSTAMFAVTARTAVRVGRVGLRSVATHAKPNNNANKFKFIAGGTATAAGAGTVTFALLGFGSAGPDWAKIRADIVELLDNENAFNPSKYVWMISLNVTQH